MSELKKFKRRFYNMLKREGISGDQIYNCDETCLYYRLLPSKTLVSKEELGARGYKKSKDKVTVFVCSNVTSTHKLNLVVISKSKNPRAFKKMKNVASLPVYYKSQKSTWMNGAIFKDWFYGEFVPSVSTFLESQNLPKKVVLLVDNAPSYSYD